MSTLQSSQSSNEETKQEQTRAVPTGYRTMSQLEALSVGSSSSSLARPATINTGDRAADGRLLTTSQLRARDEQQKYNNNQAEQAARRPASPKGSSSVSSVDTASLVFQQAVNYLVTTGDAKNLKPFIANAEVSARNAEIISGAVQYANTKKNPGVKDILNSKLTEIRNKTGFAAAAARASNLQNQPLRKASERVLKDPVSPRAI